MPMLLHRQRGKQTSRQNGRKKLIISSKLSTAFFLFSLSFIVSFGYFWSIIQSSPVSSEIRLASNSINDWTPRQYIKHYQHDSSYYNLQMFPSDDYALHKIQKYYEETSKYRRVSYTNISYSYSLYKENVDEQYIKQLQKVTKANLRSTHVVNAIKFAWDSYAQHSMGCDELLPLDQNCSLTFCNLAITLIDASDTLFVTGLLDRFEAAAAYVAPSILYNTTENCQTRFFEASIRLLGGLLGAYDVSLRPQYLQTARMVGDLLASTFSDFGNISFPQTNLKIDEIIRNGTKPLHGTWKYAWELVDLASWQVEFNALTQRAQNDTFASHADRTMRLLWRFSVNQTDYDRRAPLYIPPVDMGEEIVSGVQNSSVPGIVGSIVYVDTFGHMGWGGSKRTMDAPADSSYEYLLKTWLLKGRPANSLELIWWRSATKDLINNFVVPSDDDEVLIMMQRTDRYTDYQLQHTACFVPGMLALGIITNAVDQQDIQLYTKTAIRLCDLCWYIYVKSPLGLPPDQVQFSQFTKSGLPKSKFSTISASWLQRPELVESLYMLWKLTDEPVYQERAWKIFMDMEQFTKIKSGGYSGLVDCSIPGSYDNMQQSWLLAETFKYLYFMFAEKASKDNKVAWNQSTSRKLLPGRVPQSVGEGTAWLGVDLDKWIFTTEAHLIKIPPQDSQY